MNNTVNFKGAQPPKCEKLPDGGTRFYYNVTEGEPFVNPTMNDDGTEGEPEILPTWNASFVDVQGEVTRDNVVDALIRSARLTVNSRGTEKEVGPYSLSNELAVLRQRDSKPEDFADYDGFAEGCKSIATGLLAEDVES